MNHSTSSNQKKPIFPHRLRMLSIFVALLLFMGFLVFQGLSHRWGSEHEIVKADENLETVVTVARPKIAAKSRSLILPGELSPFLQTQIYSRTSGTLRQRFVDIGDHVKKGQLLAVVDVPEIDQEMLQAKAALNQSVSAAFEQKTRMDLAKITYERWQKNVESGGVSQQDADQRKADYLTSREAYRVAQATIAQNKANLRRVLALQNYKNILAPFSGVITSRNVDAGANIVGGGSSTSTNLFTIAQMDKLRIFINVPQANVDGIRKGLQAQISVPEQPKKIYYGVIARMSDMVDPQSRTMKTEVDLANPNNVLSPGRYAQVTLDIPQTTQTLTVPNTVLIVNADGTHVMLVQPDNTLKYVQVTPGRDDGENVEILNGIHSDDVLVTNPPDTLKAGQEVKILKTPTDDEAKAPAPQGQSTPPQNK